MNVIPPTRRAETDSAARCITSAARNDQTMK
jgi:hypothetical protein